MKYKVLQGKIVKDQANATISDEDLTMRWHGRLRHVSYGGLKLLSKRCILGKVKISPIHICEHCILGKQQK